ncbi:hypothetical protein ARMGADRAFT_1011689 [Armillaria gallica]|uniref:Uncharacterized protein n=1 Tax=Armillaria gallica TaxID=47427 RepID=A0A2H3DTM3_ARMGA|nr:hypothetical protein ARMGADRAFT_1011689 [Armillaria gallica]
MQRAVVNNEVYDFVTAEGIQEHRPNRTDARESQLYKRETIVVWDGRRCVVLGPGIMKNVYGHPEWAGVAS